MVEQRIKPSNVTFSILIKIYGKSRQLEKALNVLEEMKGAGVRPGLIVFTCLIQACIKSKQVDMAIEKFHEMKRVGIQGDSLTYETILKGCLQFKKFGQACDIVDDAFTNQINIAKDLTSSLMGQIKNSKNVALCARLGDIEKMHKASFYEAPRYNNKRRHNKNNYHKKKP